MKPKEGYLAEFRPYCFVYAGLTWSPVIIGPFIVSGESSWSMVVLRTCRIEPLLRDEESGDYLCQFGSSHLLY